MFKIPSNCTGCHACASICVKMCIEMRDNGEGFLYPYINQTQCVECGQCEKVCPVLHKPENSVETRSIAVKSRNETERSRSTSGGVFPILAEYILNKGGVVCGAAYDEQFNVKHIMIEEVEEISRLQGAKYTQSEINVILSKVKNELISGRMVLFSGTPCQCAGLKAFLGKKYDKLITVDLVCHGVPSPKVWKAYVESRKKKENQDKRILNINMRSKSSGWSYYNYSTEFVYDGGHSTQIPNGQDLFMKAFIGDICLRNSCAQCQAKGVERCTDFTLGDYWGIWKQHPEFDDNRGTSVVFIHSKKGIMLLEELKEKIEYLEVSNNNGYQENRSMIISSKAHPARKTFLEEVTVDNFEKLVRNYFPEHSSTKWGIIFRVKNKMKKLMKLM